MRFCGRWTIDGHDHEVCLFDDHLLWARTPTGTPTGGLRRLERDDLVEVTGEQDGTVLTVHVRLRWGATASVRVPTTVGAVLLKRWEQASGAATTSVTASASGAGPDCCA
ncbi:hypothetical protein [Frigoribacterium salinisoli]